MSEEKRNKVIIMMDSVRADTFAAARAPNMKSVGPTQVVHSVACWTLPSLINTFLGYPPIGTKIKALIPPQNPRKYPNLIQDYYKEEGYCTAWVSENPWVSLLDRLMNGALRKDFEYWIDYLDESRAQVGGYPEVSREIIRDARDIIINEGYGRPVFLMMLSMTTHHSYYDGEERHGLDINRPDLNFAYQKASIEYYDTLLGDLFQNLRNTPRATDVVIFSDHGEMFGPDCISHNPIVYNLRYDEKLFEIPFIRGVL